MEVGFKLIGGRCLEEPGAILISDLETVSFNANAGDYLVRSALLDLVAEEVTLFLRRLGHQGSTLVK